MIETVPKKRNFMKHVANWKETTYHQRSSMRRKIREESNYAIRERLVKIFNWTFGRKYRIWESEDAFRNGRKRFFRWIPKLNPKR